MVLLYLLVSVCMQLFGPTAILYSILGIQTGEIVHVSAVFKIRWLLYYSSNSVIYTSAFIIL